MECNIKPLINHIEISTIIDYEGNNIQPSDMALLDGIYMLEPGKDAVIGFYDPSDWDILGLLSYVVKGKSTLYINYMYIREEYRRQGIGTQAIEYLKTMGYEAIHAHGFTQLSENFFYKIGFKGDDLLKLKTKNR